MRAIASFGHLKGLLREFLKFPVDLRMAGIEYLLPKNQCILLIKNPYVNIKISSENLKSGSQRRI